MSWPRSFFVGARKKEAIAMLRRADAARDCRKFRDAAELYKTYLSLRPDRSDVAIQLGHMAKEIGDYDGAEQAYLAALTRRRDDPDLALQLGHFYKTVGRWSDAKREYRRAIALRTDFEDARRELTALGFTEPQPNMQLPRGNATYGLVPELAPVLPADLPTRDHEEIIIRRLGRQERTAWGVRRMLSGVEAIRGQVGSIHRIVEVQILLDGRVIHRERIGDGSRFAPIQEDARRRKFVFNAWIDFGEFQPALRMLELRVVDDAGAFRTLREPVVIVASPAEAEFSGSDAAVSVKKKDVRSTEQQIRAQPSVIRAAARTMFPNGIHNVLVLRTDQLGDMVASIPAMARLRQLLPNARIAGLLTEANADFARTLGLFDEVIEIDFPDDLTERRRLMTLAKQQELRDRLAPYHFDIGLDLSMSHVSRELLLLSGAPFLHGMTGGDWPWLSSRLDFHTPDYWTGGDKIPHSSKVLAIVESLGTMLDSETPIMRRRDLSRDRLLPLGIGARDAFVVLHTGARIDFSRWPHFRDLAKRIIEESGIKVVLVDEHGDVATMTMEQRATENLIVVGERLSFDDFDALLSYATVVVGNDSGPKHLASLRGTNVVTLFSSRINWAEWGQENVGSIISRRVPCAGCSIHHDADECGKDFSCIRDIGVDEVLREVLTYLDTGSGRPRETAQTRIAEVSAAMA